jgi:hypothetical protein
MSRFRWIDESGGERVLGDIEDLAEALESGTVKPDTLLFDSHLERWLKASDHDVARALQRRTHPDSTSRPQPAPTLEGPQEQPIHDMPARSPYAPPPGHPADLASPPRLNSTAQQAPLAPHPWRRWFARLTDYAVFGFALGLLSGASSTLAALWDSVLLANILTIALFIPVEASCLSAFGTTIGKALLGISLSFDGKRPPFARALGRATDVWSRGLGLGIPLVTLFTMAYQHARLTKEGVASYDRHTAFSVTFAPVTIDKVMALVLIWTLLLALIVLDALSPQPTY